MSTTTFFRAAVVIVFVVIAGAVLLSSGDDSPEVDVAALARAAARSAATSESATRATAPEPSPAQTLSGSGDAVRTVTLKEGRYRVTTEITGNRTSSGWEATFSVLFKDREGFPALVANDAGIDWTGEALIAVGDGILEMESGVLTVEVDVRGTAGWTVWIEPIR